MRALTLDYRRRPKAGWAGVVLLAAGAAAAVMLGGEYQKMLDAQAAAESGLRRFAVAERRKLTAAKPADETRQVDQEIKRARRLLRELSMPWDDMFASVESVNMRHVGLLGVETDIDRRVVKIDAEAKSIEAMLEYVRAMEARPTLADVYLHSHQIQLQDPQRPVRFVLTARWLNRTMAAAERTP